MKKIITQAEKELLQQKILKLEEAFDKALEAQQDQELLFAQVLKQLEPGEKIQLPDGRTFHVVDPYTITDCGEQLPQRFVPGKKVPRWSWEIRNAQAGSPTAGR